MPTPDPALLKSLRQAVETLPADQRLRRIQHQGRSYWIKRPEQLSLRWRLQKGSPRRAFERERLAYKALNSRGLPIAPLVIEGPDYLVTRDAGQPINQLLSDPKTDDETRITILTAAARGLHQLHEAGAAHGRPNLKDILWDGKRIDFIDFERFGKTRNLRLARMLDYVIFAFSCFAMVNQSLPQIDVALHAYRTLDTEGTTNAALRLLNTLSWLRRPAAWLGRKTGAREVLALPKLLDWAKTAARMPVISGSEPRSGGSDP